MPKPGNKPSTFTMGVPLFRTLGTLLLLTLLLMSLTIGIGLLPLCLLLLVAIAVSRYRRIRCTSLLWVLAISVKKGLPLPEEVEAYAQGFRPRQKKRLIELAGLVRAGVPLAEALEVVGGLLPPSTILAIRVGQEMGTLPETLRDAAVRTARNQQDRLPGQLTLNGLVAYTWLLLALTATVVSFQMYWIIPKYKKIFEGFGMELPPITLYLIQVADLVVNYFPLIVPCVLSMFLLCMYGAVAFELDWERSRWPLRLFPRLEVPGILRNLASLVTGRRPLGEGLYTICLYHHRGRLGRGLSWVLLQVEQGRNAWEAFCEVGLINAGELSLLNSAERVGNLPWALLLLSDRIERLQRDRLLVTVQILQPVFIFAIGGFVCFYAVAMFYPIVSLTETFFIDK